ncbi:MAG: MMPL family transporter, partial [Myxococcota bacterium]|nr:MMPL family transporter [Myxococcota bacterium]
GVALSLAAVYLVLPPLSVLLHRARTRPPCPPRTPKAPRAPAASRRLAWTTVLAVALATALTSTALGDLRFDGDMRKMRMKAPPQTNELRLKYYAEAEKRAASPALVITDNLEETRAVYRHFQALAERSDRLSSAVSIFTFVPEGQAEKLAIVAEMKRRIDNKYGLLEGSDKADADQLRPYLTPSAFGVEDLPEWVRERFTDTTGALGRYVLLYPLGIKSQAEEVIAIQDAIGHADVEGKRYYSTASWMFTGDAYLTVQREGPLAVGLAALVVFLVLLFDSRRLGRTLLTFLPLALGFILLLGVLGWADIPLNLFNIVVLPAIFGIGVDTAIHLSHRLREGHSVAEVLRTTGAAAGMSALTTAIGFASLLAVDNEGLRSIGWVAVIGIACTFVCTTGLIAAFETLRVTGRSEVS